MRSFTKLAVTAAAVAAVQAADPTLCDKYTTALLKENTGENQLKVLELIVSTALIGNYTQPNMNAVPGILAANATYNGEPVNLAPYFSGALASTNRGGSAGVSVNFLDGGGAAPVMKTEAGTAGSNQNKLLTHLYQYFGALLGCSQTGFPMYTGSNSQYNVHKFMVLSNAEVQYFIQQVALSAKSFGVTDDDLKTVGDALNTTFGYKCSPAAEVIPGTGKALQSICTADDCPMDPKGDCSAYPKIEKPTNATSGGGSGSGSSSGSAPSASSPASSPGPAPAPAPASTNAGSQLAVGGVSLVALFGAALLI